MSLEEASDPALVPMITHDTLLPYDPDVTPERKEEGGYPLVNGRVVPGTGPARDDACVLTDEEHGARGRGHVWPTVFGRRSPRVLWWTVNP